MRELDLGPFKAKGILPLTVGQASILSEQCSLVKLSILIFLRTRWKIFTN